MMAVPGNAFGEETPSDELSFVKRNVKMENGLDVFRPNWIWGGSNTIVSGRASFPLDAATFPSAGKLIVCARAFDARKARENMAQRRIDYPDGYVNNEHTIPAHNRSTRCFQASGSIVMELSVGRILNLVPT
ncbi:hypothetical protein Ae201684P_015307 [Aphanomyces euteiches]|nr:hypothetical protein Ae201684P_015307 [Aphanomyces euteiches]